MISPPLLRDSERADNGLMTSVGMNHRDNPRRFSEIVAGELQPVTMGCETDVVSRPYNAMAWIRGACRNRLCWVEGEFVICTKRQQFRQNSQT